MAKFLPGAVIADIRGSIGGNTFARNPAGSYVRNRTIPVDPSTVPQQARRALIGYLSSSWRDLTQSQQNSWIAATPSFPRVDSLGQAYTLTGQQLFIYLNYWRAFVTDPLEVLPPDPLSFSDLTLSNFSVTDDLGYAVDVSNVSAGAGYFLHFFSTGPSSSGRNFFRKSEYRYIASASSSNGTFNLYSDFTAIFGSTATMAGQKISLYAQEYNATSGQVGVRVSINTIVQAV